MLNKKRKMSIFLISKQINSIMLTILLSILIDMFFYIDVYIFVDRLQNLVSIRSEKKLRIVIF